MSEASHSIPYFFVGLVVLLRMLPSTDGWITSLPPAPSLPPSSLLSFRRRVSSGRLQSGTSAMPPMDRFLDGVPRRTVPLRRARNADEEEGQATGADSRLPQPLTTTALVNGEQGSEVPGAAVPPLDALHGLPLDESVLLPLAPPLSYDKFLKMQDKRVVVTVRYSGESGLRPYFLTVAKKLKASHPDVVIERRILPSAEPDGVGGGEAATFEILVDGKVVIGKKNRTRRQRVAVDLKRSRSVFVSMQELDVAISRARRRRRPNTTYGGHADES